MRSTSRRSVRRLALATTFAVCLAVPGSASAATTFGADLSLSPDATCGGCAVVGVANSTGVPDTGSPNSGVLVSARIRTTGAAATGVFRVLHLTGPAAFPLRYRNDGEAALQVAADGNPGGQVTEVLTRLKIQAGDHLGVAFPNQAPTYLHDDFDARCGSRGDGSDPLDDHALNTEADYEDCLGSGIAAELLVQGTVEADADGDGFGDETQDQCPANASVQSVCPVPAAKKCKKGSKLKRVKGKKKKRCVKKKRKKN